MRITTLCGKPFKLLSSRYAINNDGVVFDMKNNVIVKQRVNTSGYLDVSINLGKGFKNYTVHRLVTKTFLSYFDSNLTVNHKDSNKLNNNINNLEMMTHAENMKHAYTNNLIPVMKGEKNGRSKLTEKDISYILSFDKTIKHTFIAKLLSISACQIGKIRNRKPGGWL